MGYRVPRVRASGRGEDPLGGGKKNNMGVLLGRDDERKEDKRRSLVQNKGRRDAGRGTEKEETREGEEGVE